MIGDAAHSIDEQGNMHPGVAPVAIQQGRFVGRLIRKRLKGEATDGMRFRYVDKGNLATIGRSRAIGEFKKLHLSGLPAWLVWIFVHILYLIGFKNKIVVMFNWAWSYFTFRRGARLITPEPQAELLEEADASSGEKLANP